MIYKKFFKRVLDIIFSLMFIIIFSPILIIIYVLILITSGLPVLFIQKRVGQNEKRFFIYKFRTMENGARTKHLKGHDPKKMVTKVGKVIRKIHFDELPQLFNILKGDMSFIGPRPLAIRDFKVHLGHDKGYHKIAKLKPGLTSMNNSLGYLNYETRRKLLNKLGLIKRSNIKKHDKLSKVYHDKLKEREFYYMENMSFLLDLRIIWWTLLLEFQNFFKMFKKK